MQEKFFETDHWKLLATAKRYLAAANLLRRSDEYKTSNVLLTPVLHLTAHGLEVLLKANLVGAGLTVEAVKDFGHDISSLWEHDLNRLLRDEALSEAQKAWCQAQASGSWPDTFDADAQAMLQEHIRALSTLHTKESKFALRYIAASDMEGPRPHLLVETFLPIADLCVRQPRALIS